MVVKYSSMIAVFAWSIVPGSAQISMPWRKSVSKSASTANCTTGTSLFAGTRTRTRTPRRTAPKSAARTRRSGTKYELAMSTRSFARAIRTTYSRWMLRRERHWLASTQTGRLRLRERGRTSRGAALARELAPRAVEERAQLLRRFAAHFDDVVPPACASVRRWQPGSGQVDAAGEPVRRRRRRGAFDGRAARRAPDGTADRAARWSGTPPRGRPPRRADATTPA